MLDTQTEGTLRVECTNRVVESYEKKELQFDLIILNNDLMSGIPRLLTAFDCPILPKAHLGWHSRSKYDHFEFVNSILADYSKTIDIDPWLLSCVQGQVNNVHVSVDTDLDLIAQEVARVLELVTQKYKQYNVDQKPYVMLKANSGTYGMGVMNFDSPEAVLSMNRKTKNKLSKGKHSSEISSFLIQEGVTTCLTSADKVVEPYLYYIGHEYAGGFLRNNSLKVISKI